MADAEMAFPVGVGVPGAGLGADPIGGCPPPVPPEPIGGCPTEPRLTLEAPYPGLEAPI